MDKGQHCHCVNRENRTVMPGCGRPRAEMCLSASKKIHFKIRKINWCTTEVRLTLHGLLTLKVSASVSREV